MNFNEYKELAMRTKNTDLTEDEQLGNAALGLIGETGEIIDLIKKNQYQGHPLDIEHIKEEVGDVLWYIALLADTLEINLDEVANNNINKLKKRYPGEFSSAESINR